MGRLYAAILTATCHVRQRCARDDEGGTAVEYGLIVTLIAVAIIGAVSQIGGKVSSMFTSVANALP